MKLSELYGEVGSNADLLTYALYLAAPDKDGRDVDLASVGRVELDFAAGQARLFPESTTSDAGSVDSEPYLDQILSQLPTDASGDNDLVLVVETPLLRDESDSVPVEFADVFSVRVGTNSKEVWLLLRPAFEFADGLLPD